MDNDKIGTVLTTAAKDSAPLQISHEKFETVPHGGGDALAATFLAHLLKGKSAQGAMEYAVGSIFQIMTSANASDAGEAFKYNFTEHDELGAQFCLMRDGETLLDLKGGWVDRRKTEPVKDNTLFGVYSSGKAIAALATLWNEFDQQGKGDLTIAQLLSHQAGLSGITDKDQRILGRILRDEFSQPFEADVWIGLPKEEHDRCAQMIKPKAMADLGELNGASKAAFMKPWSSTGGMGLAAWREAQLAGSNCHATAKGLAILMQIAVSGRCGETSVLSEDTLAAFHQPRISGQDLVLPFEITFAAGVMKNDPNYFYGPTPSAVGHSGWGGSCVFADPETGLHGAYVMNRQHNTLLGDVRPRHIIDAAYQGLGI